MTGLRHPKTQSTRKVSEPRKTRLIFDARYIRTDFHDGISRFSAELASAVAEQATEFATDVAFLIHDEAQRTHLPEGAQCLKIHAPTSPLEPFTALRLNRQQPDVVFSPMQTIGSLGRRYGLILTLHDTIYYRHRTPPRNLPWLVRLGWRIFHLSYVPQRFVLNRADVVATVSETSKREFARVRLTRRPVVVLSNAPRDLTALLPEEPGDDVKNAAVAVAVAAADHRPAPQAPTGPRNIIYMGSFMPYKNVETLVRAMAHLPEHTLHLLSRISPARQRELQQFAQSGAAIVFHNGVSDAEYARLLHDNAVLATLSLDEGYGLPIAEALACGVPAVVSDTEIFREVAGQGALYVAPYDAEAVVRAIRSLDCADEREKIIAAGKAHAATYSWRNTANELLQTVQRVAAER